MKESISIYLDNKPEGVEVNALLTATHATLHELDQLASSGEVIISKKGNVKLLKYTGYFKGVLSVHAKGFGFVKLDNSQEVYIPKESMGAGLPNVSVLITIDKVQNQKSTQGKIVKVLTSVDVDLVGLYTAEGTVVLDDKRFIRPVVLTNLNGLDIQVDQKVIIRISKVSKGVFEGELLQIIGHKNDPGIDILSIIYTHQFSPQFEQEVVDHANLVAVVPDKISLKSRKDFTGYNIITIDGADAKDLDDAIHVKKTTTGYELGVHIADVSHYVVEGSVIDKEAFERSTSVYLADRVIPMLPHVLSNGVCSLTENELRLTMSCVMQINTLGEVTDYQLYPSYICSNKRFTYDEVNEVLIHDNKVLQKRNEAFMPMLRDAHTLSTIIQKTRIKRGSIDFDIEESKLVINDQGDIVDIKKRERYDAEKLIEDFMIMANECVAKHLHDTGYPALFRVHERPSELRLKSFQDYTAYIGHPLKVDPNTVEPLQLQNYLTSIHSLPVYPILATQLLRSMAKAKYFEECSGHFGLSSEFYTHFTSPIRRYPDLVIHRLIKQYDFDKNISDEAIGKRLQQMAKIADQTSKKERDAIACEREVESLKKAQYMTQFVGDVFEGVICSIQAFGMFVELDNTIEGLVHVMDMRDDFYIYDEKQKSFIGQRRKRVFRLGDRIKVKVKSTNLETKTVDFVVMKEKKTSYHSQSKRPPRDSKFKKGKRR